MFQSYSYSNGNKYTIIDSDFQEAINNNNKYWIENFITVYSRRNLNVALNIFLFMQYQSRKYGDEYSSIKNQISRYKEDVKNFNKYLPEINKYLSLI